MPFVLQLQSLRSVITWTMMTKKKEENERKTNKNRAGKIRKRNLRGFMYKNKRIKNISTETFMLN